MTRREMLKATAAAGVTAFVGQTRGQDSTPASAGAAAPAAGPAPAASKPLEKFTPVVGMQIGALPLAKEDLDRLLETLRERGGINTLFVFAYGHVARWVPMAQQGFRGGNFAIPHMQYYKDTHFTYEDMRAPEFADVDILERTMKATRKHGFKTYALIEEADKEAVVPAWQELYEIDSHGRKQAAQPGGPCSNNPLYRGFTQGLAEDYLRSYGVDGFMWSSERQGGMTSAMGAWHHGGGSDPTKGTCFCEHCLKKAAALNIDAGRAKEGFAKLERFIRDGRARQRPRDGYFVSFFRLLLAYPELLQWESLWVNSRTQFMTDLRNRVKSVNPDTPVGFHVWHNASFSPFYRAEIDFTGMAKNADFIKPVLYNVSAGERMTSFVNSVGRTIFGDIPQPEILQMLYAMFDYKELPFEKVGAAGFSTDYIAREVQRTLDDIGPAKVPVYAGLDIDIPGAGAKYTPESVKQSVMAAFNSGARGVIFARNYAEMKPANLGGVRAALDELGLS